MSLTEMAATKKPAKGKAAEAKGSKNRAKAGAASGKAEKGAAAEAPKRKLGSVGLLLGPRVTPRSTPPRHVPGRPSRPFGAARARRFARP